MVIFWSPGAPVLLDRQGRATWSRCAGKAPVDAIGVKCVCAPRTPGQIGRDTRARAPAGPGRAERKAKKMRHACVNLMGRPVLEISGAAVVPAVAGNIAAIGDVPTSITTLPHQLAASAA
ncbi:hypothetical protein [uncultured Sphingomonas sp.]|uniref:hypothetical protein n=1 Tax=uncultured Sphingomonas sp. TaxID=158754 RepID=UPI0035CA95D6